MNMINREKFLKNCPETVGNILTGMERCGELAFSELPEGNTVLVIVDVINGFVRECAMACADIGRIVNPIAELMKTFTAKGMPAVAFGDCHTDASAEFASFPPHCLKGTSEAELVPELKKAGDYIMIPKNSTNGFLEREWQEALCKNPQTNTFVVCGDCTDICVLQFCLSMKAWFNMNNRTSRIIIPLDCVDTYGADNHNADFMNLAAYKIMSDSGIEFVSHINTKD